MSWDQPPISREKASMGPAQAGTAIFIVLTFAVLACYLVIFVNPQMPLNPFPPAFVRLPTSTPVSQAAKPTTVPPTFTPPRPYPPTWTITPSPTPSRTYTPRPTFTHAPPTATPRPLPPFSLSQKAIYTEQSMYAGAQSWWTGLAGEVVDKKGMPVTDVTVRVWDNEGHTWDVTPGDAPKYASVFGTAYGSKGTYAWWERVLDGSCQEKISVHVQIIRNGRAASDVISLTTAGDCKKGLIILHFVKNY